jgi:uncharacterized membrane protein YjdF
VPASASADRPATGVAGHGLLAGSAMLYVVGLGAYGFATGARLTVSYVLIVAVLGGLVASLDQRVGLSRVALAGLWLWGLGHLAGGTIGLDGDRVLYNAQLVGPVHFDNIVHFIGFAAAGLTVWEALRLTVPRPWMALLVVWLFGQGVGALNEVIEFIISNTVKDTNIGGYHNTGRDLVANLFGSALAGMIAAQRAASAR